MSLDDGEDTLYKLGCDCESHFDQLGQALTTARANPPVIQLCGEFQQRFAIWAAYLGLFARKSQSLDRRLRNFQDLQDLVTRLLDILRRSLQQCVAEVEAGHVGDERERSRSGSSASLAASEALRVVDDTLNRLNRLGVTIRQSSRPKIDEKARKLAEEHGLKPFIDLCTAAVQLLYPGAHQSLKDYLGKSMTDRYARVLLLNSRQKRLGTRREPRTEQPPIPTFDSLPKPSSTPVDQPSTVMRRMVLRNLARASNIPSQSDLSSIDIQRIRARLRPPDEPSVMSQKTMSVRVNQGNYPKQPDTSKDGTIFTCEWCSEPLNKKTLSESDWRRHIDRDLKPYVCLSETCPEAHPFYPTFDEWVRHMDLHNRRWYQQVYLTPSWICTVCTSNPNVYDNSQALFSHLDESHRNDFTTSELQAISRQSKTEQSRTWNDCLLCGFTLDEQDDEDESAFRKRRKGHPKQETIKGARRTLEMTNPDPHTSDAEDSDTSSDSEDASSRSQRTHQTNERTKAIARHVAAHLQVLMFLTLRFAALQNDDDQGGLDGDVNSDSADIDEGNSDTEGRDLGRVSDIDSENTVLTHDDDADSVEDAMELDDAIVEDDIPVPDTDLDLVDIPRRYDDLSTDIDPFLEQVIKSGAYQTWRDEQNEQMAKARPYYQAWKEEREAEEVAMLASHWKLVSDTLIDNGIGMEQRLEASRNGGETPLLFAVKYGLSEAVISLLANGARPNERDPRGNTPLHVAVIQRNTSIADMLLEDGANIEASDDSGWTPLTLALKRGFLELSDMLLKRGADHNAANGAGSTPLMLASEGGFAKVVYELVSNGANVNAVDNQGRTALMLASENGFDVVVRDLVSNGADVNAADNQGRTPLTVATSSKSQAVIDLLLNHDANAATVRYSDGLVDLTVSNMPGGQATADNPSKTLEDGFSEYERVRDSLAHEVDELMGSPPWLNAIKSLTDSEAIFVRDINIGEEIYKATSEACPKLDAQTVRLLFRNSEEMLDFHTSFLQQLKTAVSPVYEPRKGRKSGQTDPSQGGAGFRIHLKLLGSVFGTNLERMKLVHGTFLRNSEQAESRLIELQQDPTVKTWLHECSEAARDLTTTPNLQSLLRKPIHRFNEYPTHLGNLLQAIPDDHPDKALIRTTKAELEAAIVEIEKAKANFELVGQIISKRTKEPESRASLTRFFSRNDDEAEASNDRGPRDPVFDAHYERFGDDYLRLQVVLRDVEYYTRQVSSHVQEFHEYATAIELTMRLKPGSHPQLESKWVQFNLIVGDLQKVHLEEHVSESANP